MQKAERQGGPIRIGAYEIVRPLARGGMAELFLARVSGPASFEKLVVVKKILPKYADNPRFAQLFLDEAKLAASLSHKNVVAVHDFGGTGSEMYFAMEYIHGQDVRSILHRVWREGQKLPIHHAVQIAAQVASALHYAHEKRRPDGTLLDIVHRDVSPSNVLVSYDGAVKLVDFGVAKAATRTVKTRTGTLKGKIAYMSPEQAKGAAIDRRSDVFSLGIVLWEMVTTTRLFRGENDLATLQLIINQPIKKPTLDRPDCPPELERIVLKALAQDVAKRYQTADELARDLEELVRVEQLPQSAGGLSVYMSGLFKAELDSWESARAHGVALSEHLTAAGELTTPISESEFIEAIDADELEEAEEDDEVDVPSAVSGTIENPSGPATVPGRRMSTPVPGTPIVRPSAPAIPGVVVHAGSGPVSGPITARAPTPPPRPSTNSMGSSSGPSSGPIAVPIAARGDARGDATAQVTPLPPPGVQSVGAANAGGGRNDATELVKPLPPPGRPIQDSSPWPTSPTPGGGLAQGSWPQGAQPVSLYGGDEALFSFEQAQKLRRQFTVGGLALIGLVFLVALVKCAAGGGGGASDAPGQAAAAPADASVASEPPDAAEAPVQTKQPVEPDHATPPAVIDAGVAEPPPPPPVDAAVAPTPTPAIKKPPVKKPPGKRPPVKPCDPNAALPCR